MSYENETVEGYVVDIACIRKYPRGELLSRAKEHTQECATMGHCVESGYGLISDEDVLTLLETKATPRVLDVLEAAGNVKGVKLRATRRLREGEMVTTSVELVTDKGEPA